MLFILQGVVEAPGELPIWGTLSVRTVAETVLLLVNVKRWWHRGRIVWKQSAGMKIRLQEGGAVNRCDTEAKFCVLCLDSVCLSNVIVKRDAYVA